MSGRWSLVALFVATLPLVTPKIRGADEIQYFSHLRSLVFDQDLDFENEYRHFHDRDPRSLAGFKETFMDRREEKTGRPINFTPIGCAALWSPFYLAVHGAVRANAFGAGVAADGLSSPYLAAACYASALYGFLGLLLIHDALRRWGAVAEPAATWTLAALWLGTPVLYYMTLAPGFAHASSLFAVSLLVWLWLRALERSGGSWRDWALVGAAGGLAALIREQDGLFLAIPGLSIAWETWKTRRWIQGASRSLVMGLTAALVFVPQLLAYHALNGSWGPTKLVARKMTFGSPHFFEVLVDPGHGLFLWTPLLLAAAAGLAFSLLRRRDATTTLLALGFLLQVWINGSIESWSQAGAFGSRRFVSTTPAFAWGLAAVLSALLPRMGRLRTAAALALFVWWNASLMVQFGLKLMDRQKLEWPKVAVNQFTEVPPRLGRVAVLFFTDRERLVKEGL